MSARIKAILESDPRGKELTVKCSGILASGLKWLKAGDTRPANGRDLENAKLAETLMSKTGFTQQEWDAFDIKSLRMETYIKSGGSYFKPAVRDLHDGDFIKSDDHYYKPSVVGVASGLKWMKADDLQRPMVGWRLKNSKLEVKLLHIQNLRKNSLRFP